MPRRWSRSLRAAAEAAAAAVPGVRMEVTGGATPAAARAHAGVGRAARRVRGVCARRRASAMARRRCSAAARTRTPSRPLGVPAIDGLGPRGAGFHTTTEYVELATFVPKAEALVRFLWGRR